MTGHTATVRISDTSATLTYIGGPTALLEWRGLRLLTDPTFDPAGTTYEFPGYTLRKTQSPGLTADREGWLPGRRRLSARTPAQPCASSRRPPDTGLPAQIAAP